VHFCKTEISVDLEYDTYAMFVQLPSNKLCKIFLTYFILDVTL